MRTLCVRQPWADLIASGKKTIELRTWRIKPGPLAIAASKKTSGNLPGGVVVAVVEVVGCRPAKPEDSAAAYFRVEREGQFWAVELAYPLRLPVPDAAYGGPIQGTQRRFEQLGGRGIWCAINHSGSLCEKDSR